MMLALADRYRPAFEQYFLAPHWAGLTNMADLPSVAAVLATMWAALRAVDSGRVDRALLAGAFAGVAIGIKPANAFFVPALVVLFAGALRPRLALACAAGLAPALLTLIVWKSKGLGHLPITSTYAATREAAAGPLAVNTSNYVPLDFHHLKHEFRDFQEVFWSIRLLEFLAVAGIAGAIRRVPVKGLFLATWFAAFCLVKGSSSLSELASTSYFRYVEPGLPAFVLLIPAIGFLWPVRGRRLPWRPEPRVLAVAALAGARDDRGRLARAAADRRRASSVTNGSSRARVECDRGADLVRVDADSQTGRRRRRAALAAAERARLDQDPLRRLSHIGRRRLRSSRRGCRRVLSRTWSGSPRRPSPPIVDRPAAGRYVYRVGVVSDYKDTPDSLDLMLLSKPRRLPGPLSSSVGVSLLLEPRLEQREALREDHVLVGEPRDHGRVVQQHERSRTAARPRRARPAGSLGLRASRRSCSAPPPGRQRRAARDPSGARAARSARAAAASGSARRRRAAAAATPPSRRSRP